MKYKPLGKTDFKVSICGFGCYRIDKATNELRRAMKYAVMNGINLIDTSPAYLDGGSEMLVGQVLNDLMTNDNVSLNDLTIVTKGGYIQGENLKRASKKENAGKPYPEVVKCDSSMWHCIHPSFLKEQISASLERLKLKRIDVYLLHDPENFLAYSSIRDFNKRKEEYYRRIKQAFVFLEKEAAKGRISYYGISSNTFVIDEERNNFTSLEKVVELANEVSVNNHFAVVQLPANLIERGGLITLNQNYATETVLQAAKKNNLGVLISRPLNARIQNKSVRLADFEVKENTSLPEINKMIDGLKDREDYFKNNYVINTGLGASEKRSLVDCLSLGIILKRYFGDFQSPNHFLEVKEYYLIPRANYAVAQLVRLNQTDGALMKELRDYAFAVKKVTDSIESLLAKEMNHKNAPLHETLNKYLPEKYHTMRLSQKAVLLLNSVKEITSTMIGMRTKAYVDDILAAADADYIDDAEVYWKEES